MRETQMMLNEAIQCWGMNDIVTIMLSQKRDKEIIEEQRKELDEWNKKYNHQLDLDNGEIYSVKTGETIGEI
ncbi:MAG: hypothetical protein E7D27_13945 [Clostridium celatum]|nr:hypothetical protein [Clostridium celatum]